MSNGNVDYIVAKRRSIRRRGKVWTDGDVVEYAHRNPYWRGLQLDAGNLVVVPATPESAGPPDEATGNPGEPGPRTQPPGQVDRVNGEFRGRRAYRDPSGFKVVALEKYVQTVDDSQVVAAMIEEERQGKGRVTALDALERRLDELIVGDEEEGEA